MSGGRALEQKVSRGVQSVVFLRRFSVCRTPIALDICQIIIFLYIITLFYCCCFSLVKFTLFFLSTIKRVCSLFFSFFYLNLMHLSRQLIFEKQSLFYFHKIVIKFVYTLSFPRPTVGSHFMLLYGWILTLLFPTQLIRQTI